MEDARKGSEVLPPPFATEVVFKAYIGTGGVSQRHGGQDMGAGAGAADASMADPMRIAPATAIILACIIARSHC